MSHGKLHQPLGKTIGNPTGSPAAQDPSAQVTSSQTTQEAHNIAPKSKRNAILAGTFLCLFGCISYFALNGSISFPKRSDTIAIDKATQSGGNIADGLATKEPNSPSENNSNVIVRHGGGQVQPPKIIRIPESGNFSVIPKSQPTMGILLTGMGLGQIITEEAIAKLSAQVGFAFATIASNGASQALNAQKKGHEIFLQMPFEAKENSPKTAIKSATSLADMRNMISAYQKDYPKISGIIPHAGDHFFCNPAAITSLFAILKEQNLLFIQTPNIPAHLILATSKSFSQPYLQATNWLSATESNLAEINASIKQAEFTAQENGSALLIAAAIPQNIETIMNWQKELQRRGILLAPVSHLLQIDNNIMNTQNISKVPQ